MTPGWACAKGHTSTFAADQTIRELAEPEVVGVIFPCQVREQDVPCHATAVAWRQDVAPQWAAKLVAPTLPGA